MTDEKTCPECKTSKPLAAFGNRVYKGVTRWHSYCIECRRESVRRADPKRFLKN